MATTTKRKRNPTQADIIATMLAQTVNAAQDAVQAAAQGEDRQKAIAARNALIAFKARVDRYLDGDTMALYS